MRVMATGYNDYSAALAVAGDAAVPVVLDGITYTPSTEPDSVTVRWLVIGSDTGTAVGAGTQVNIRIKVPPDTVGYAWGKGERAGYTDATGTVSFANVPLGCTIRARLGSTGEWYDVEIPADATSPFDAPRLIGVAVS